MKKILLFLGLLFLTINVYAEGDYVKSIKIDLENLPGFSSDNLGPYNYTVDSSKNKILIGYEYDRNIYDSEGIIGDIDLNYGENRQEFTVINRENREDRRTYVLLITRLDNRSSDNSLTSLMVGSSKVILSDSNNYDVTVDGKLTSVEIKATLPDKASFISGYGERIGDTALELKAEKTQVEIKVKAENGDIRTYNLNIIKSNYLNNDATLKSLTIDGVDFSFKSDTYEYNLNVKYDITKVKINAIQNNDKAVVEYDSNVNLNIGENKIEIKVKAEDKSVKTYILNIIREEEVPIVSDIKIKGIDFSFSPKTYNYKIETDLKTLDFNITLSSETATTEILNNDNLKNGSTVKIRAKDNDKIVTYSFKIINKTEEVEKISVDSVISDSNFFKDNEMLISLVIFGVGIFATLTSVLLKRKR